MSPAANTDSLDDLAMIALIRRIEARIPDDASKPGVLCTLIWLADMALMLLAVLFVLLKWITPALVLFWLMFALALCFMGCVVWGAAEMLLGRRTTWR